ncbi:hypothetical protein F2P81_008394 [Scophthalmus maximus]|uniref:Homeodomain-only protein n=1 Tax=Scophthalmus maximus TaxID=52904 RepID=A0A6A4T5F2_SCOMX|nr:hypothetical protein F2P81_008394 [Scophthalmus maximus]
MASQAIGLPPLSEEQVKVLEENFKGCRFPDGTTLMLIAAECGLSEEETLVGGLRRGRSMFPSKRLCHDSSPFVCKQAPTAEAAPHRSSAERLGSSSCVRVRVFFSPHNEVTSERRVLQLRERTRCSSSQTLANSSFSLPSRRTDSGATPRHGALSQRKHCSALSAINSTSSDSTDRFVRICRGRRVTRAQQESADTFHSDAFPERVRRVVRREKVT